MKTSKQSISDKVRQWATLAAIIGTFAVNVWSNLSPINGLNIGEIANTLFSEVQILPANYAFSIWGVIYLGLFAFGVYQLLPSQRENPVLRRVDYLLILVCVVQAAWVLLFLMRQFWLSLAAMIGILLPLIGIYLQMGIGRRRVSREEKWLAHIPFSIYLGWISVATVVNVAIALYSINWDGFGLAPQAWTVIMLLISTAIAAMLTLQRRDMAYPLVMVWALIAIAVRQANIPLIATTAVVLAIALALLVGFIRFKPNQVAR